MSLLRVYASVDAKVFLHREGLTAILTLVWLFTRVCTVVTRQSCGYSEYLAANVALVRILAFLSVGT